MPFPRAPTGLQDSCVTPAPVTPAQAGVQKPAGFLLAQTLKNAVSSCGRRPTGFLCDPCPRFPCASRGPDPVRLHSAERGTRHRFRRCGTPPGMVSATACGAGMFRHFCAAGIMKLQWAFHGDAATGGLLAARRRYRPGCPPTRFGGSSGWTTRRGRRLRKGVKYDG